jgi:hypothetical protein
MWRLRIQLQEVPVCRGRRQTRGSLEQGSRSTTRRFWRDASHQYGFEKIWGPGATHLSFRSCADRHVAAADFVSDPWAATA